MAQQDEVQAHSYPIGRGYGHDYMRGGEVLGGYGYSERPEYDRRRGELHGGAAGPDGVGLDERRTSSEPEGSTAS
jgi:hypothetical protein